MPLYAADIESLAKPIKKVSKKKAKEEASEIDAASVAPTPPTTPVKEKKPPTEKQLAARAKFAENRKKKLEEKAAEKARLETEAADKTKEIEKKDAEIAEKKKARAEKRKAKAIDAAVDEAVSATGVSMPKDGAAVKKQKKEKNMKKDESVPPAWFNKFVESAKMEESKASSEKKPAKQIREEAKVTAQEQWGDGFTRDRVTNEVDKHMSRLYGMIFARK